MTPKEKAKELYCKYIVFMPTNTAQEWAKTCALICADEAIRVSFAVESEFNHTGNLTGNINYWKSVKKEIAKL